jgi:hypothetical protein
VLRSQEEAHRGGFMRVGVHDPCIALGLSCDGMRDELSICHCSSIDAEVRAVYGSPAH